MVLCFCVFRVCLMWLCVLKYDSMCGVVWLAFLCAFVCDVCVFACGALCCLNVCVRFVCESLCDVVCCGFVCV